MLIMLIMKLIIMLIMMLITRLIMLTIRLITMLIMLIIRLIMFKVSPCVTVSLLYLLMHTPEATESVSTPHLILKRLSSSAPSGTTDAFVFAAVHTPQIYTNIYIYIYI